MTRAADSVGITPGSGAEIAAVKVGSKRHQVMVLSDEFGHMTGTAPTYRLLIPAQVLAANKVFFDLFHAAGTDRTVRVLSLRAIKDGSTAVALATSVGFALTRTTDAGTGGTLASYNGTALASPGLVAMDPANDDVSSQLAARSTPTAGATAGAVVSLRHVLMEETSSANYDTVEFLTPSLDGVQPLVVPAGTGIRIVQTTAGAEGALAFEAIIEVVGPPMIKPYLKEGEAEPTVSGTGVINEPLTVTSGTWEGYPTPTISYQWENWNGSDWVAITGATTNSYTPTSAKDYRCTVTATSTAGSTSFNTTATTVVSPFKAPVNSVAPDISGDATVVGGTLTCGNGVWVADPEPTFGYQWESWNGSAFIAITGATKNTYVTAAAGDHRCMVTASNSEGSNSAPSNILNVGSTAEAPTMVEAPTISGNAYTDSTITCHPGTWSGDGTLAHSYQWQVFDNVESTWSNVTTGTGGTTPNYKPTVAATYACLVVTSNSGGQAPSVRSNTMVVSTAPVLKTTHLNELFDAAGNWIIPTDCTISGGAFNFKNQAANVTGSKPLSLSAGTYEYEADILAGDGITKGNLSFRLESALYTSPIYTDVLGTVTGSITVDVAVTDVEIRVTRQDTAMDIKVGRLVITSGTGTASKPTLDYRPVVLGKNVVNEVLTCTKGVWFAAPEPTYAYAWERFDGTAWVAATGTNTLETYTPTTNGDYRCVVTTSNSAGSTAATSNSITISGGSVGTGTYTRARVMFDELWGGTEPMIATLNFHATVGGIKLDGTPSASSEAGSLTSASKANDTSIDSYWQSALDLDPVPWWELLLPSAQAIKQVTLAFPDVEDFYVADAPRDFRIQGWDGTQWVTLKTVTNDSRWTPATTRTYNI